MPAGATAASSVFVTAAGAPTTGVLAFGNRNSNDGFVGGGQIGYNYQFTPGLGRGRGYRADAQYVDFGRSRNQYAFATVAGGAINPAHPGLQTRTASRASTSSAPSVPPRLRLGPHPRYATGGFAYGSAAVATSACRTARATNFQTGWAVGGGVEYALPTDSFLNFFRSSAVTLKSKACT